MFEFKLLGRSDGVPSSSALRTKRVCLCSPFIHLRRQRRRGALSFIFEKSSPPPLRAVDTHIAELGRWLHLVRRFMLSSFFFLHAKEVPPLDFAFCVHTDTHAHRAGMLRHNTHQCFMRFYFCSLPLHLRNVNFCEGPATQIDSHITIALALLLFYCRVL